VITKNPFYISFNLLGYKTGRKGFLLPKVSIRKIFNVQFPVRFKNFQSETVSSRVALFKLIDIYSLFPVLTALFSVSFSRLPIPQAETFLQRQFQRERPIKI
jgi:hypothetical protein